MLQVPLDVLTIVLASFVLLAGVKRETVRTGTADYWIPFETSPVPSSPVTLHIEGVHPTLSAALTVLSQ